MGKTALATQIAISGSEHHKANSLMFSLEMSAEQLMQRIIAPRIKVSSRDIRQGNITDTEWAGFIAETSTIRDMNFWIEDSGYITPSQIRSRCLRHQARHGLDLVVIDYIQIMSSDGKHGGNKHQEVAEISRGCKQLARELNIPVLLLSQLSRSCESRADKRPMLSDLRESGAIEADADQVWFIYRDDVYDAKSKLPNVAEIILSKHRNGPTGTIMAYFEKQYTMFKALETNTISLNWQS